jgi:hypothetical protein
MRSSNVAVRLFDRSQSKRSISEMIDSMTDFDLWGCERLPGSSKVQGEPAERQA